MYHKEITISYITSIVTSPDRHGISFHPIMYTSVFNTEVIIHVVISNKKLKI